MTLSINAVCKTVAGAFFFHIVETSDSRAANLYPGDRDHFATLELHKKTLITQVKVFFSVKQFQV